MQKNKGKRKENILKKNMYIICVQKETNDKKNEGKIIKKGKKICKRIKKKEYIVKLQKFAKERQLLKRMAKNENTKKRKLRTIIMDVCVKRATRSRG